MYKYLFIVITACCAFQAQQASAQQGADNSRREEWLRYMDKIARPVIQNLAEDKLKQNMPVLFSATIDNKESRGRVAYLEAFGRTLSGIAPWLNIEEGSPAEQALRKQYRAWSLKAIANSVNPKAKDYLEWRGGQPLVDASFFTLALVRCPWLWEHLDTAVQKQVVTALVSTRGTVPVYSNWLLFSGMIETFFCKYGLPYDAVRIDYGIREFWQHWYTGDGMFSDGMQFHMDYYNSYVIQPYLSAILPVVSKERRGYEGFISLLDKITKRYAAIQERMISTDGTFPVTGRSIVYRGGAFQHLANMAYTQKLPAELTPQQVRCALAAVLHKTMEAPSTFTQDGWLNIGLYGHQPKLADFYITTGSLYLCTTMLLPLGLPPADPFWSAPAAPWTAVKVWSGEDMPADHAMDSH
ncbi:hypothetical protein HNQ91_003891 [Filimonas zeae]|uniref:DUF2264 domain-containing protein n=1 Tax=Filimonas zeae TaxID=1737353 RepID=A0A917J3U0_9BACT|nr:DUF2264 domain-containing protein [Filimonas zeae]MDR6340818.1 hypothetical protein [Filimonas zeae]GGH78330.1 hypothetical protein GCM10011379_46060 [Filimonas zeae]